MFKHYSDMNQKIFNAYFSTGLHLVQERESAERSVLIKHRVN